MNKIFVWTGNAQQFKSWCDQNNVHYKDPRIIYLHDVHQLYGMINPIVLKWGTWYERKDCYEIERVIKVLQRREDK